MSIETLARDPRVTIRKPGDPDPDGQAVIYWMQRAQRASDNPALDTAIALGNLLDKPVVAFLGLHPGVRRANLRHYQFLVEGLDEVGSGLRDRRVGFVLRGPPSHRLRSLLDEIRPVMLIGDENPLRQTERWRELVAEWAPVPFWTVDADVIVPARLIETEQYAARTLRPRINRHLDEFLRPGEEPTARHAWTGTAAPPAASLLDGLPIDRSVAPVHGWQGGAAMAHRQLARFVTHGLPDYHSARNHPDGDGTSRLSPYLHFGQIGPRTIALAVRASGAPPDAIAAFLEQLIVRRELGVNFVRFNPAYDRLDGCERWARMTLQRHQFDPRPHVYSAAEFETAATHDPLWNAAQRQMVETGWMHGYLRMYWAKKILEWSADASEAFSTAIVLNDRYELDGRDPNGYANIAWAIGGKHDRPWPSRPVFGTVRSMSLASTSRKFDAGAYITQHGSAADVARFTRLKSRATR